MWDRITTICLLFMCVSQPKQGHPIFHPNKESPVPHPFTFLRGEGTLVRGFPFTFFRRGVVSGLLEMIDGGALVRNWIIGLAVVGDRNASFCGCLCLIGGALRPFLGRLDSFVFVFVSQSPLSFPSFVLWLDRRWFNRSWLNRSWLNRRWLGGGCRVISPKPRRSASALLRRSRRLLLWRGSGWAGCQAGTRFTPVTPHVVRGSGKRGFIGWHRLELRCGSTLPFRLACPISFLLSRSSGSRFLWLGGCWLGFVDRCIHGSCVGSACQ